ncbi:MAG: helix-turn-helix domain-containing protein [Phycisphaerae bacterium]
MQHTLTPRELAQAIGVSESSLKRWADQGLIQVSRTAGKHRRITLSEAVRFVRQQQLAVLHPAALGMAELAHVSKHAANPEHSSYLFGDELADLLLAGESLRVRAYLLNGYLGGRSVASLADGPIRAAMERIGKIWTHDPAGIFLEHRATEICLMAVTFLRALLPMPHYSVATANSSVSEPPPLHSPLHTDEGGGTTIASAPVALGGAPAHDPYQLPALLAAATLQEVGYHSVNLGPQTPNSALEQAVGALSPRLVWLTVSVQQTPTVRERELEELVKFLESRQTPLIIGGRALAHHFSIPHANLHVAGTMTELAAYARGLRAGA